MDAPDAADSAAAQAPPPQPDVLTAASGAFAEAVRVAEAALALLRAELRLARSSALALIWLAFALVFLGVGAWLATSAAIAAGVYELTGNLFYGIGSVALANLIGIALVLFAMRGCWRDLTMPRTRRVLGQLTDRRT
jgi:hypothetical protein